MTESYSAIPRSRGWFLSVALSFFAVMVLDHVWVTRWIMPQPWAHLRSQNAGFDSIATAESYAYNAADYPVVLVGSSTASQMPLQMHPIPGLYTIAQPGGSAMTGLETILRAHGAPKILLVESDFNERDVNQPLIQDLFDPVSYPLRGYVPGLRYTYNLSTLLAKHMVHLPYPPWPDTPVSMQAWHEHLLPELGKSIENLNRPDYLPEEKTKQALVRWRQQIDAIRARGTQVYFYHVPYDSSIGATRYFTQWHQFTAATFPDIPVIAQPDLSTTPYYTSEGYHLSDQSSQRFMNYLIEQSGADRYLTGFNASNR